MGTAVWTPPPEQLLSTLQAIGVQNLLRGTFAYQELWQPGPNK